MTPNDLITVVTSLFPRAFGSETSVETWLETYRQTLGHLRPDQLKAAWDRTIASWEKTSPPMPKHILDNVPVSIRAQITSGGKTMRGMCDALPQTMADLMAEWWRANGHWFDGACDSRGLSGDRRRWARGWMGSQLRTAAHYQAQLQYWKGDDSPVVLSDDQIRSVFNLAAAPENPLSRFKPPQEGASAFVRDGKRSVRHSRRYSWMDPDEGDPAA